MLWAWTQACPGPQSLGPLEEWQSLQNIFAFWYSSKRGFPTAQSLSLPYSAKGIVFSHCPDKMHDKCHLREGCFSSRFGEVKSIVTRRHGQWESGRLVASCPGQQAQKWMPGPGAFLLFCLLTCLGFESLGGVGGATRVNSSRNPHRKR